MSKKSDFKDSVKAPDAFISTSHVVLEYIEKHAYSIGAVVVLSGVVGLGYVGYNVWLNHKETAATEAIYKIEAELKKVEMQERDQRAKKMQELAGLKEKVEPVDFNKDYAPIVGRMKEVLKAQADTRAAVVSALNLSHFLVQQKQFAEALNVIQVPSFKPSTNDLLGGFWRMHYGLVLLENNKPDEAIQLYNEVIGAPVLQAFHSEALLKTAIAYELKGDAAQAKSVYEKIGREYAGTEAANSAAQYQRLLEMKGQ